MSKQLGIEFKIMYFHPNGKSNVPGLYCILNHLTWKDKDETERICKIINSKIKHLKFQNNQNIKL